MNRSSQKSGGDIRQFEMGGRKLIGGHSKGLGVEMRRSKTTSSQDERSNKKTRWGGKVPNYALNGTDPAELGGEKRNRSAKKVGSTKEVP